MKGVSFAKEVFDSEKCYRIVSAISGLNYYFQKFNGDDFEIAMAEALYHAMEHFDEDKGELVPYLKKLAREIMKPDSRLVFQDFLENTVSDEIDSYGNGRTKVVKEPEATYIDEYAEDNSAEQREQIIALALNDMNFFVVLCESLLSKDTTTKYFPKAFKTSCLKLAKAIPLFNAICLDLYFKYKDGFAEFMLEDTCNPVWHELDAGFIAKNTSKRVKFINKATGAVCKDPDKESWNIKGVYTDKRIVKVPYREIYDIVSDLIDSDTTNQMKFCIEDSFIFRSLGGSISCVNSSLFAQYDIFIAELVTNLLYDMRARYLAIGSECVYLLVPCFEDGTIPNIPHRNIRGVNLDFEWIDVTP